MGKDEEVESAGVEDLRDDIGPEWIFSPDLSRAKVPPEQDFIIKRQGVFLILTSTNDAIFNNISLRCLSSSLLAIITLSKPPRNVALGKFFSGVGKNLVGFIKLD